MLTLCNLEALGCLGPNREVGRGPPKSDIFNYIASRCTVNGRIHWHAAVVRRR